MSDAEIQLLLSRRPTITPEAFSFVLSRAEERLRLRLAKERIELALLLPDLAFVAPVHADNGRRLLPPYSYHQIHAREDWALRTSESLGLRSSGFDDIVECHFPDVQAFKVQLSRPDVSDEALADERNFIDHARSIPALYRMDVHPQ